MCLLRDIAQLEAVSKDLRCRLNDGKVWQALARRVAHRSVSKKVIWSASDVDLYVMV